MRLGLGATRGDRSLRRFQVQAIWGANRIGTLTAKNPIRRLTRKLANASIATMATELGLDACLARPQNDHAGTELVDRQPFSDIGPTQADCFV